MTTHCASLLALVASTLMSLSAVGQECGGGNPCGDGDTASQSGSTPATGAGNPIDVVSGNKYVRETDGALTGELSLSFTRHYNSAGITGSAFGGGWSHSYETVLTRSQREGQLQIDVLQGDGRRLKFVAVGEAVAGLRRFVSVPFGAGFIEEDVNAIGQVIVAGARAAPELANLRPWRWRWSNGRELSFDGRGILKQITSLEGERIVLVHDSQGRLTQATDTQGRFLSVSYWDSAAELLVPFDAGVTTPIGAKRRIKRVALSDGRGFDYFYDTHGLLAQVRHSDGTRTRYEYATVGDAVLLAKRWARDGQLLAQYAYDASLRATYTAQGEGINAIRIGYRDPTGLSDVGESRVSTSQGAPTVYRWRKRANKTPQLIEAIGPGCPVCPATNVRYHYTAAGELSRIDQLDSNGATKQSEEIERDAHGRMRARYRIASSERTLIERYSYSEDSVVAKPTRIERPSVVAGQLHTVEFEYNDRGQVTQLIERGWDPAGITVLQPWDYTPTEIARSMTLSYDGNGRITRIDGPRTHVKDVTTIEYDEQGRVSAITYPDGSRQAILVYDAQGRPTHLARTGSPELTLSYDNEGRLTSVSESHIEDAGTVKYEYDARGRLSAVTAPDGKRTVFKYDAVDRRTEQIDERSGYSAQVIYDADSRIEKGVIRDRSGQVLRLLAYSYDAQARLTAVRDGAGRALAQYGYDNDDAAPDRLIDPLGLQSVLAYDELGRLTSQQAPDGGITRLSYDDANGARSFTAPNGANTRYLFNDFGQRIREDSADRGSTRYFYDEAGNLTAKVDARGKVQRYAYDASNRLAKLTNAEGATTLHYQDSRLIRIAGPWGEEQYAYDARGRLTTHTRLIDGHDFSTTYSYDAHGRLNRKTLPGGETLNYRYAKDGQLQAIAQSRWWGQEKLLIGFPDPGDGIGVHQSTWTYGNDLVTQTKYDQSTGRIERRTTRGVLDARYEYDTAGHIVGLHLNNQVHRYGYDAVGRLTQAVTPVGEFDYQYDTNGNRLSETTSSKTISSKTTPEQNTYRYSPNSNRLKQVGTKTYAYDQTGNPLAIGERRYEYNSTGRPTKLFIDNTLKATYTYNAWGERIKKVVYSGNQRKVTYFFYDDHQLTAEADGDGEITQQYVYLGHAPVITFINGDAYYVHSDHLGTPRAITDENQKVVWTAQYQPFGAATVNEDSDRNSQRIALNLRFPGQYADAESGTYYNYQRDFDPTVGRYRTSDPIGLDGGSNTFAYVGGNPLLGFDPQGLAWEPAGDEAPGWLNRILVGQAVHEMFAQYMRGKGYGANDSFNGTFDGLRPDVYQPGNKEIWELKPLSNRDSTRLRLRAEAQLARYLAVANRPQDPADPRTSACGGWSLGRSGELFGNGELLGYVQLGLGPLRRVYEITLWHDTRPGNTGLVFYRADLIENPTGEFFEQLLRELGRNPWILWPPTRTRPPAYP